MVYAQRAPGRPGLLAWKRPEIIAAGVRGLAAVLLETDARLRPQQTAAPAAAPPEQAVAVSGASNDTGASPPRPEPEAPAAADPSGAQQHLVPPAPGRAGDGLQPHREISDETAVGSHDSVAPQDKDPSASASPAAEPRPEAGTGDAAAAAGLEQTRGDNAADGKGPASS